MTRPPLDVALVWHMHQPYYRDDVAGIFMLPWVRRRATKDYLHMLRVLERHPGVRVTMNMVPSLLLQLELYAGGNTRDADRELCLRAADELTPAERRFLVAAALHNDHGRRVALLAPMMELLARVRNRDAAGLATGEIRDLQLWTLLAWIDSAEIRSDADLRALAARGSSYTEEDKALVNSRQLALLAEVIPAYRAAVARGQVEPMTTPLQHPILPLLIDQRSARVASPSVVLPQPPLEALGDAELQVARGREEFHRLTGTEAPGMWPAECAVSPAAAALMARAGVRFAVSDEGVLARTLGRGAVADVRSGAELYMPHRDESGLLVVFRDADLSNRVGFSYQAMDADAAAADLVARLEAIAAAGDAPRMVTLALDGENFKDFYAENGTPFLDALYTRLAGSTALTSSHLGTALDTHGGAAPALPTLWTGSWIDADLRTWIGDRGHTPAWARLAAARRAVEVAGGAAAHPAAHAELLVAEASDWFWWFGDHHDSGSDAAWDALYRAHLRNAYVLARLAVPGDLDEPILESLPVAAGCEPLRSIDPPGAGDAEWRAAGVAEVGAVFGAMRPPQSSIAEVRYGAGGGRLHLGFGSTIPRFDRAVIDAGPVGRLVITQPTRALSIAVPATGEVDFSITFEEPGRGTERVPQTGTLSVLMRADPDRLRVLVVAVECAPLAVVGSLAGTVAGVVAEGVALGHEVVVIIPRHGQADVGARPGVRIGELTVSAGGVDATCRVLQGRLTATGSPVLSLEAPAFFDRDAVYGCADDGDRFLAFCAMASAAVEATGFRPDIVHGFEWQTAALLHRLRSAAEPPATVFSTAPGSSGFRIDATDAAAAGIADAGDGTDLADVGRAAATVVDCGSGHGRLAETYRQALQAGGSSRATPGRARMMHSE